MRVTIEEVHPGLDGEYPLDIDTLTNREYHEIKRVSGVRAGELNESLFAGDLDVVVALALIAMKRNGKDNPEAEAVLMDGEGGRVRLLPDGDAVPPVLPLEQDSSVSSESSGVTSEPR